MLNRLGLEYNLTAHLSVLKSLLFAEKARIGAELATGHGTFGPVEAFYFTAPIPEEGEDFIRDSIEDYSQLWPKTAPLPQARIQLPLRRIADRDPFLRI